MQEQPGIVPTPLEFASDVLGVELWAKQREVLSALVKHRRVAVKSGNGLGKGFCAAVALLWFIHAHKDAAIALSTAPTFRQVRHVLWRQVRRLYRPNAQLLGGKMLDTRWEISDDRYAMGLSAENADQFQGFHSPNMLIVVDEAEGVSDEIYEAIEAVMTTADPLLLLIGNPTTVTGAFRRAFYEERQLYHNITISALDSPNVQAGKTVVPGLTSARWVEERRETWGEDNPIYRARVLGEFPDQAEDTLIGLSDVEAAAQRWKAEKEGVAGETEGETIDIPGEVVLAVDVARFGSDRSVILRRQGSRVLEIRTFRDMDTMQLAGWVAAAIRETSPERVCVDEIGVGAGVVDRLKEQGHPVKGINVARRARQERLFANVRAEGYWRLKELFATGEISIPDDHQLMGELAALRYSFDSQGRVLMESKEAMRQRGLPSPDKADALMLAFLESANKTRLWT
ncbi:MAG: hypothetical protein J4N75_10390 [Chloroflexi bacterium]|nr:hypothetical protein [Chloroflexota bacterium]MCI0903894.1 hypothetical protein [Chloroflexota bacterium]